MLSSIHPLGERARGNRWWITVAAFAVAATAGGCALGAAVGAIGWAAAQLDASVAVLPVVAVAALAGAVIDATRWPRWLWRPRRQVDENWLQAYRGWVYGAGFGVQLGMGLVTIVTGASFYVALLLATTLGSVFDGVMVGAAFGATRGLCLLAGRSITDPQRLVAFHRRLARMLPAARAASVGACAVTLAAVGLGLRDGL